MKLRNVDNQFGIHLHVDFAGEERDHRSFKQTQQKKRIGSTTPRTTLSDPNSDCLLLYLYFIIDIKTKKKKREKINK